LHIAHQDLKPSNVVTFDRTTTGEIDTTKIADLGHAHDRRIPKPGVDRVIAGDPSYAPPEQLYNSCPTDWDARRFAADLYQLGGLSVFLMTGVGATELMGGHLRPEHHWDVWLGGSYADILPHLVEATDAELVRDEVVVLTRMLLDPDPTRRAHPKNLGGAGAPYGLERFISRFNVLAEKAERALRRTVSR
jgi:serine/threonine protein kinase